MLFVIIGHDGPSGKEGRKLHRAEHLRRLEALEREGRLLLAGPFTDGSGSLIIIEAKDREEVEAFMEEDPYVREGVFSRYEVKPFLKVLPRV